MSHRLYLVGPPRVFSKYRAFRADGLEDRLATERSAGTEEETTWQETN